MADEKNRHKTSFEARVRAPCCSLQRQSQAAPRGHEQAHRVINPVHHTEAALRLKCLLRAAHEGNFSIPAKCLSVKYGYTHNFIS